MKFLILLPIFAVLASATTLERRAKYAVENDANGYIFTYKSDADCAADTNRQATLPEKYYWVPSGVAPGGTTFCMDISTYSNFVLRQPPAKNCVASTWASSDKCGTGKGTPAVFGQCIKTSDTIGGIKLDCCDNSQSGCPQTTG